MQESLATKSWYALRVRAKSESLVGNVLEQKGFETFTATYQEERVYSRRIYKTQAALFPGYVFCRFTPDRILPVVSTPAVQHILTHDGRPTPVDESLIETLRRFVETGEARPHRYLTMGRRVRVQTGALSGLEGILIAIKGKRRLVINADLLQRSISIELDAASVTPL